MPQVTLEILDELVTELIPYREHLLDLLRLGLGEREPSGRGWGSLVVTANAAFIRVQMFDLILL